MQVISIVGTCRLTGKSSKTLCQWSFYNQIQPMIGCLLFIHRVSRRMNVIQLQTLPLPNLITLSMADCQNTFHPQVTPSNTRSFLWRPFNLKRTAFTPLSPLFLLLSMSSSTEKESRHNSFDDIEAKPKLSTDDVSYSEHDGEKVMINKAPDGGWKAWLVVLGSFCVSVLNQFYHNELYLLIYNRNSMQGFFAT